MVTLKSKKTWSKEKDCLANNNFKALNAILVAGDIAQFKLIFACEFVRDA